MDFFRRLSENHLLIAPFCAFLMAQLFKIITNLIVERKFDLKAILADGGMPSGHSATVSSLAIMCGYTEGIDSSLFAISMVLMAIVMKDAMGVRREAGKHAVSIKQLAEALNKTISAENEEIRTENLKVLVGHTPLQVFFGFLTGVCVALSYILIFLL